MNKDFNICADSVFPTVRLTASQVTMPSKPTIPSGVPKLDLQCNEVMNVSESTNKPQRKRQLTDEDGFVHPCRSKMAKAGKAL